MKPGDLVKSVHKWVGVPLGTIGLVLGVEHGRGLDHDVKFVYVEFCGEPAFIANKHDRSIYRRYLESHWEPIT